MQSNKRTGPKRVSEKKKRKEEKNQRSFELCYTKIKDCKLFAIDSKHKNTTKVILILFQEHRIELWSSTKIEIPTQFFTLLKLYLDHAAKLNSIRIKDLKCPTRQKLQDKNKIYKTQ